MKSIPEDATRTVLAKWIAFEAIQAARNENAEYAGKVTRMRLAVSINNYMTSPRYQGYPAPSWRTCVTAVNRWLRQGGFAGVVARLSVHHPENWLGITVNFTRAEAMCMARDPQAREGLSTRSTRAQAQRPPTARFEIHCDYLGLTDDRGRCPRCEMITDAMQDTRRVGRSHKPNRIGSLGYVSWWKELGSVRLDPPTD